MTIKITEDEAPDGWKLALLGVSVTVILGVVIFIANLLSAG